MDSEEEEPPEVDEEEEQEWDDLKTDTEERRCAHTLPF